MRISRIGTLVFCLLLYFVFFINNGLAENTNITVLGTITTADGDIYSKEKENDKMYILKNGKRLSAYDEIRDWGITSTNNLYYIAKEYDYEVVVHDNEVSKKYDFIEDIDFDSYGNLYFLAKNNDSHNSIIVKNGEEFPTHIVEGEFQRKDGVFHYYFQEFTEEVFINIDGKEFGPYDEITELIVFEENIFELDYDYNPPKHRRVYYFLAEKDNQTIVVSEYDEFKGYDKIVEVLYEDGYWLLIVEEKGKKFIVRGNKEYSRHETIPSIVRNRGAFSYLAYEKGEYIVVSDDNEEFGPYEKVYDLIVSSEGDVFYVIENNRDFIVMHNDEELSQHEKQPSLLGTSRDNDIFFTVEEDINENIWFFTNKEKLFSYDSVLSFDEFIDQVGDYENIEINNPSLVAMLWKVNIYSYESVYFGIRGGIPFLIHRDDEINLGIDAKINILFDEDAGYWRIYNNRNTGIVSKNNIDIQTPIPISPIEDITKQNLNFIDLTGNNQNYSDSVSYIYDLGIVNGYTSADLENKEYRPQNNITRAEFLKIVLLAAYKLNIIDIEGNTETSSFSDVSTSDWFFPYVQAAIENNIVNGYPNGTFRPHESISFAESSKIIVETLLDEEIILKEGEEWFTPYIEKLVAEAPELESYNDKNPADPINRGDMAEFIYWLNH